MQTLKNEILDEVLLCDANGQLNPEAIGWSRKPLHRCNLKGRFPRKKKWDYWCITSDRFLFSATVAHTDYLALGSVYLLIFETSQFGERTVVRPFPQLPLMPETVEGDVVFSRKGLRIEFQPTPQGLHMAVQSDNVSGKPLFADLNIERPPDHETLNVVVPWDAKRFQFTSKQHALPTRGTVRWGGETFTFIRDESFACLDFGRGIWPYKTTWNWAAFSVRTGQDVVGINMGAQWTDGTGMNENGIVVNGKLHKVFEDVVFHYDPAHFMQPWTMKTSASDMIDLTFTPFFERSDHVNLLLIRSDSHQMFGRYTGTLNVAGKTLRIDNALGWAEEHRARW